MIRIHNSQMPHLRDMTIMGGWLFADLLLCLAVIFLIAVPPAPKPVFPPPVLHLSATTLKPGDANCPKATRTICTIQINETANSHGNIQWRATSDMDNVHFSPANGLLMPGDAHQLTISSIPCQNGSFTFYGQPGQSVMPVTVLWRCTPVTVHLSLTPFPIDFTIGDLTGFMKNTPSAIQAVKQKIQRTPGLAGHSVGFAIVNAGAPTTDDIANAQAVDGKVINVMRELGKQDHFVFQQTSYYDQGTAQQLFYLYADANKVYIDVYFFVSS